MAEDQTRMAFMSDADEKVDPVSGNDVPPGSLPEEVRDDIDAKLSEGEYVVPADVVRFFGVKLFEDLRMEAKRGLAAMDEDGRIGGEPVPEEVYNDDEVVTDEDLEKLKGMLTTGMADGGLIDKIVNAAKTDPTVNKVLNAQGVTVGMAEGGVVKRYANGGYEEGKVAEALKGVMGLVKTNPKLQEMLATKGLKINTTGADKTAEAMEKANKPNVTTEPIMDEKQVTLGMAEGGVVAGDPFDFEEKARASAAEGDNVTPAQMKQVLADFDALPQFKGVYNEDIKYLADAGSLVTAPNSTFNFQDWMTVGFTPATDMFSFLANNTEGLKMIKYVNADGRILELAEGVAPPAGYELYTPPAVNPAQVPVATQPVEEKERKTGDDSRVGPEPEPDTKPTPPPDFSEMTTDELKSAMDSAATVNKFSNLGMLLGPIGALGGIAIQATMRSRGIQIGKAAEEKLKSTDKSSAEYAKLVELVKRGGIASSGPTGWIAGKLAKKAQENAAAAKEGGVDPTPTITAKVSSADITKTSSNSINEGAQTKGAKERLDAKIEAERKAADAARFAQATAAGNTRITQKRRTGGGGDNGGGSSGGSSGGGGMPGGDTSTTDVLGNTTSTPGGSNKPNTSAGNYGDDGGPGGNTGRDDVMSGGGGYSAPQEDYDSSGPFNKGGLINKPKKKSYANGGYVTANEPAKKKKRKGLGTRP
jgi:Arc/MetJ-type ribon-helix-helix transcriptional regulator